MTPDELPDLYNLTPVARMMLLGVLISLGPLLWVGWKERASGALGRRRSLTLITLFLTFDLVVFGAFTRLSDSGLGCPDWPGCYGQASPLGAVTQITAAQTALPSGPVTHSKAWIEMVHRYLATGVGVLILVLAAMAWLDKSRRTDRSVRLPAPSSDTQSAVSDPNPATAMSPWWPTLTLVWVCIQGAFGALTVTMKLFPAIVTLHLLGGLTLLALLACQYVGLSRQPHQPENGGLALQASPAFYRLMGLAMGLLVIQIALGGWVSTNYAVLACSDFPQCQNSWWPDMNFEQGFTLWRHLGMTAQGEPIAFEALTAIHYVHRLMAYGLVGVLACLAWRMRRQGWLRMSRWLIALTLLQVASGLSNVVLGWPLLAALTHSAGAAALVLLLTLGLAARQKQGAALSRPGPGQAVSRWAL
jgi:heme a synthase